jgi:hypothetical protein
MDSMDGTNGMDNMDNTIEFAQPEETGEAAANGAPDPAGGLGRPKWSGRTRRVVTSVAASAVLLGSGAGIGMAITGGASASTSASTTNSANIGAGAGTSATTASSTAVAGRCARLVQVLRNHGHSRAAIRVQALCRHRLLRLALLGGEHGEVTFQTKAGPKTIAFERGTIQAVSSSAITVLAKDGTTWSWDLTANTKLREAGHQATTANLSTGELVLVAGPVVSGTHDARLIRIRNASGS